MKTFALFLCFIAFATMVDAKPALLVSKKQHLSIVVDAPMGWKGPAYSGGTRSYETWSFSKGTDSKGSNIEIRVDPVRDSKLNWNTATKEQIKKTFADFSNPEVEVIAKIMVDQTPAVVWAAHNVDGELLIAKLRRDGCDLNFSLRTNSREELRRYQKSFLDLVRSVRSKMQKYTYDVFGKPKIMDAAGTERPFSYYGHCFLFQGREYIRELGIYDYRHRFYLFGGRYKALPVDSRGVVAKADDHADSDRSGAASLQAANLRSRQETRQPESSAARVPEASAARACRLMSLVMPART